MEFYAHLKDRPDRIPISFTPHSSLIALHHSLHTPHSSYLFQILHPSAFTPHSSLQEALAETRFRLDSLHLVVVEN